MVPQQQPASGDVPARWPHGSSLWVFAALFATLLVVSNIAATKLIAVGPLITDGGAVLFPLTYVIGDVISDLYGFRAMRRTVLLGLALSALAAVVLWIVQVAPPAPGWEHQAAFEAVLGFVPRVVLASLLADVAGQLLNSWVLVRIKQRTGERRFWVRAMASTVAGEFVDTVVFCTIAFLGVIGGLDFLNYVVVGFVYKVAVEAAVLPGTYAVRRFVRRRELPA